MTALGKHEKIVSEVLFEEVQRAIQARKKRNIPFINGHSQNDMLPFRGFLYCPRCNQRLTGSGSMGRTKHYFYYHCTSNCGFRIRANFIHEIFLEELKKLRPNPGYVNLFKDILEKTYRESFFLESINQRHAIKRIEEFQDHIYSARSLMLEHEIAAAEYHQIKSDCESKISILKNKLDVSLISLAHFKEKIEIMCQTMSGLAHTFEGGSLAAKRHMLRLILQANLKCDLSCLHQLFNNPMNFIFNLWNSQAGIDVGVSQAQDLSHDLLSKEHKTVLEIEERKGLQITVSQAQEVLAFIYALSRFAIQNNCDSNFLELA